MTNKFSHSIPQTLSNGTHLFFQISAKEDKYKKEVILLGINRKHPDYVGFKPEKRVQEPVEREKAVAESSVTKQLEVSEVYKPSSHVKPIFMAVEADMEKYYSASEASDIVFRFVSPLSTTTLWDEMIDSFEVNS